MYVVGLITTWCESLTLTNARCKCEAMMLLLFCLEWMLRFPLTTINHNLQTFAVCFSEKGRFAVESYTEQY